MTFQEEAKQAAIEAANERKLAGHGLSNGAVVVSQLDISNSHAIKTLAKAQGRSESDIKLDIVRNMRKARDAGRRSLHAEWLEPAALQKRLNHGGHSNELERWLAEHIESDRFRLVMIHDTGNPTSAIVGLDGFWSSPHDV